jgi:hypothetical protein
LNAEQTKNNMDYLTILIGSLTAIGVVGLSWLSGYQLGQASGVDAERDLANRRVNAVLASENKRKPRRTRK